MDPRQSTFGGKLIAAVAGLLMLGAGMVVGGQLQTSAPVMAAAPSTPQMHEAAAPGFADVAKAVRPAVVNITPAKVAVRDQGDRERGPHRRDRSFDPFEEFFNMPRHGRPDREMPRMPDMDPMPHGGMGSGVLISPEGHIVTNHHVVEGVKEVLVTLPDKREFTGKVIGTDPKTDLALVKIEGRDLPSVPWGDSSRLQVGDYVLAVGNPFGLNSTVTLGIVSALGRGRMGITQYEDWIQTDAAINPGNSGGALVNTRGELVGINTAIFSQTGGYQGVGFAVPASMAKPVADSLMKDGKV
ncbi:MAG TPA: trypsin-like peptidase domain-containing protein, partial [Nitrospirales bacterium]|nr:trypsin-like peptidase domain-containing protein [Nitrospirales bacterium]